MLLSLTACGSNRPGEVTWRPRWEARTTELDQLVSGDAPGSSSVDPSSCPLLVDVARQSRHDLIPAPTQELDDRVSEWIDLVGAVGAECAASPDQSQILSDIGDSTGTINDLVSAGLPSR